MRRARGGLYFPAVHEPVVVAQGGVRSLQRLRLVLSGEAIGAEVLRPPGTDPNR